MRHPDRTTSRGSRLCLDVRKKETLWAAWNVVRRRALASADEKTLTDARRIDLNPSKEIRILHEALRNGSFSFAPQKGVLKYRKGKAPRPIVVSPVRNRIVQRAILDVLQSKKPRIQKLLGEVPKVLSTPTSVGGIPGKGTPEAIALIRGAIASGATYYIRSDIIDFFSNIPRDRVLAFLFDQTKDEQFVKLVQDALSVELSNAEEKRVREWISLFPISDGVPQGSSLSALCANIVLREFDSELNRDNITMVRYIDDFVILGRSERAVRAAWKKAEQILIDLGLQVHQPQHRNAKASLGRISDGFEFLSLRFHGPYVSPSRKAKQDLLSAVRAELSRARKGIASAGEPRRNEVRLVQVLDKIDRRIRGWGDAFRETDQRVEFAQLDRELATIIGNFVSWFNRLPKQPSIAMMRSLGVALLSDTPRVSNSVRNGAARRVASIPRQAAIENSNASQS